VRTAALFSAGSCCFNGSLAVAVGRPAFGFCLAFASMLLQLSVAGCCSADAAMYWVNMLALFIGVHRQRSPQMLSLSLLFDG
jgi:hypothetical protein